MPCDRTLYTGVQTVPEGTGCCSALLPVPADTKLLLEHHSSTLNIYRIFVSLLFLSSNKIETYISERPYLLAYLLPN